MTHTLQQDLKVRMWVGDIDDLRDLLKVARDLETRSHAEVRARMEASEPERRATFIATRYIPAGTDSDEAWKEANKKEVLRALDGINLTMSVTLKAYGEVVAGKPEDVLDKITPQDKIKTVSMSLGSQRPMFDTPVHSGFTLGLSEYPSATVFASDRPALVVAQTELQRLLDQRKPWYWWLRSFWGSMLCVNLPINVAGAATAVLYAGTNTDRIAGGIAIVVVFFGISAYLLFSAWDRILSRFEVVGKGSRPRGAAALSVIGAAVLWIAGTIVIPIFLP